jgi:hypothetical protein
MSALMEENIISAMGANTNAESEMMGSSTEDQQSESIPEDIAPEGGFREPSREEMYEIEERIKRELHFVGLLDDEDVQELDEDEVSMELRRLQSSLRRIVEVNDRRKAVLRKLAFERLAQQEFNLVIEEINKQVEAMYQKRLKFARKNKKKVGFNMTHQSTEYIRTLLDRRRRLIEEFRPLFTSDKFTPQTHPVFDDLDDCGEWIDAVKVMADGDILSSYEEVRKKRQVHLEELRTAHTTTEGPDMMRDDVSVATESTAPALDTTSSTAPKPKKPRKPRAPADPNAVPKRRTYTKKKKKDGEVVDVGGDPSSLPAPTDFISPAVLVDGVMSITPSAILGNPTSSNNTSSDQLATLNAESNTTDMQDWLFNGFAS